MKVKFGIEFEADIPMRHNVESQYYQNDIEDIVWFCIRAIKDTGLRVESTDEWRFIAEDDGKEEYQKGVFGE